MKKVGLTVDRKTYKRFSDYAKKYGVTVKALLTSVMLYAVEKDLLKNRISEMLNNEKDILSL